MYERINRFLDAAADFLGRRPGFLPLVGLALVALSLALELILDPGHWLVQADLLLHLGVIVGLIGLLLIRPLS
ncbi:MAG: hypothetical protein ACRDHL_13240 [Candidatus Promineifilaceae bacterium]